MILPKFWTDRILLYFLQRILCHDEVQKQQLYNNLLHF